MKIETIGRDNRKYTYEETFFSEKRTIYIDDVPLEMLSKKQAVLKGENSTEEIEIIGSSLSGISLRLRAGEIIVIFKNSWLDWLLLLLPMLSIVLGIVLGTIYQDLLRGLIIAALATLVGITVNSQFLRLHIKKSYIVLICVGVSLALSGITLALFAVLVGL